MKICKDNALIVPTLSESGKKLVVDTFKTICIQKIDWQFIKIFEDIEMKLWGDNTLDYEIRGYYTINSNPFIIKFDRSHFIWE